MSVFRGSTPKRKIVTPEFMQLLGLMDLQLRSPMTGLFGGKRRTKSYGNSAEWADYREYTPGDDLRRLDWNLAARFDKYYVKNYVDERQLKHNIYLDCSGSMAATEEKATFALQLAAALAFLSVSNMDRASFRLLRDTGCETLTDSFSGKEAFIAAAAALAATEFRQDVDLEAALKSDFDAGFFDGISFLITDLLTESSWKKAVDYLLEKKRDVVLLHILSPEEAAPRLRGRYELFELEKEAPGFHARAEYGTVRAYEEAFAEWCRDIDGFCTHCHVPCVRILSNEGLTDAVLKKLLRTVIT